MPAPPFPSFQNSMRISTINELVHLLRKLKEANIYFELDHYLDDSISIKIAVPGEKWEVDIDREGEVQVEIFRSDGEIFDGTMIDDLFKKYTD